MIDITNQQWFQNLKQREQWILLFGVLAVVLYLFFIMFWRPLANENSALEERNQKAADTLQWMRNSAAYIKTQKNSASSNASNGQSMAQLLDTSVGAAGIKFTRFQPRGSNGGQVWFENVNFSQLFSWIVALEKQGVTASNVSINSTAQSGNVNASLQLQKGG